MRAIKQKFGFVPNLIGELAAADTSASASATVEPGPVRWLLDRMRRQRAFVVHRIVRALDETLNNTSLILLFEFGQEVEVPVGHHRLRLELAPVVLRGDVDAGVGEQGGRVGRRLVVEDRLDREVGAEADRRAVEGERAPGVGVAESLRTQARHGEPHVGGQVCGLDARDRFEPGEPPLVLRRHDLRMLDAVAPRANVAALACRLDGVERGAYGAVPDRVEGDLLPAPVRLPEERAELRREVERELALGLVERARDARARAYAPYSRFSVGAAVLTERGIFSGVNVENAAYPLGICAEKTALARAITDGCVPGDLETIAITASPCGGCRQWLHELGLQRVIYANAAGEVVTATPAELLPDTFELE
jgi:cytidine deaminase